MSEAITIAKAGRAPARRSVWGAELRATLALAWPLILTNAAQTAFTATDTVLLGWLGPEALAAGALASNLYFAAIIFGIGLTVAVSPLVAEELGRNRFAVREVRRTVRQGFWVALTVTLPIWLVLWHGEAMLLATGQEPPLAAAAGSYLRALMWAVLPFLFFLVLRSFLASLERPGWPLIVSGLAVPLNAGLAYALIHGRFGLPALGMVGAGVATTVASLFMFVGVALVVVTDRRLRRYRLFGRFWRADGGRYAKLWRLGAPIGAILAFEVTIFNAAALVMGLISAPQLAAHAIALQIAALAFMVPLGLGQAVTVRVGLAYGAEDPLGVRVAGWTAYGLAIAFSTVAAALLILIPRTMIGGFLDLSEPKNEAVVAHAVAFLALAGLFQLADGAQAVGAGMLRGLQDTRVPMIYAALGYWGVGAPLGLGLAFWAGLEGVGIWIGLAGGLAAVAVLMLVRWVRRTGPVPLSATFSAA